MYMKDIMLNQSLIWIGKYICTVSKGNIQKLYILWYVILNIDFKILTFWVENF